MPFIEYIVEAFPQSPGLIVSLAIVSLFLLNQRSERKARLIRDRERNEVEERISLQCHATSDRSSAALTSLADAMRDTAKDQVAAIRDLSSNLVANTSMVSEMKGALSRINGGLRT